jgi:hypothetical protein
MTTASNAATKTTTLCLRAKFIEPSDQAGGMDADGRQLQNMQKT